MPTAKILTPKKISPVKRAEEGKSAPKVEKRVPQQIQKRLIEKPTSSKTNEPKTISPKAPPPSMQEKTPPSEEMSSEDLQFLSQGSKVNIQKPKERTILPKASEIILEEDYEEVEVAEDFSQKEETPEESKTVPAIHVIFSEEEIFLESLRKIDSAQFQEIFTLLRQTPGLKFKTPFAVMKKSLLQEGIKRILGVNLKTSFALPKYKIKTLSGEPIEHEIVLINKTYQNNFIILDVFTQDPTPSFLCQKSFQTFQINNIFLFPIKTFLHKI